jgi:SAM-dependent methyltransferase
MAATIIAGVFGSERFFRETWPTISQALASEVRARGAVRWILGVTALKPGARILDSPCGFGRHAVAFARQGYKVTGVDFNETELGRARDAARDAGVVAEFVSADMRDTDFASEFDLAVNLEQSIGYFTDDEDRQLIDRFWRALLPGGTFVLDTRNRDQCVKSLPPEERRQFDDWTLRIENVVDAATSRWRARWFRLASPSPAAGEAGELLGETDIRLYSAHELAGMLRPERWSRVEVYGGLDGTPFSFDAPRLVLVAHK